MNEIKIMRCCMCPDGVNSQASYCLKENGLCDFVLYFRDRFGRAYSVCKYGSGYTIAVKLKNRVNFQAVNWAKTHGSFDSAQEELNAAAIKKGWKIADADSILPF